MTKEEKIQDILNRGVEEIIQKDALAKALKGKKKLRVKLGIDPTSPNIHIGRAVVLWKLRAFQDLGHQVVFIIGDFTGQIGDTSDKDAERKMLTEQEIKKNVKTYLDQAFKILDKKKTEVYFNSKWLAKLGFVEIGRLANLFGLHEFSARENIAKRLNAGKRVSVRELLYPLMQGYDSVMVKADVELGGIDQRFNLLAGRIIQQEYKQQPQNILMCKILVGTDGRKMSSSWGNTINLLDEPNEMFGKTMSIPDNLLDDYFLLATNLSGTVLATLQRMINPRDKKLALAQQIVEQYYSKEVAESAKNYFISKFSKKEVPADVPEVSIKSGEHSLIELLFELKLATSKNDARRLVEQGGVKLEGTVFKDKSIKINKKSNLILQVGKRKYIRLLGL